MSKTLEEAIGCWTTNPDYNSLPQMAVTIQQSANLARRATLTNNPDKLRRELEVLRSRLKSMMEVTDDATRRLDIIMETKELING